MEEHTSNNMILSLNFLKEMKYLIWVLSENVLTILRLSFLILFSPKSLEVLLGDPVVNSRFTLCCLPGAYYSLSFFTVMVYTTRYRGSRVGLVNDACPSRSRSALHFAKSRSKGAAKFHSTVWQPNIHHCSRGILNGRIVKDNRLTRGDSWEEEFVVTSVTPSKMM